MSLYVSLCLSLSLSLSLILCLSSLVVLSASLHRTYFLSWLSNSSIYVSLSSVSLSSPCFSKGVSPQNPPPKNTEDNSSIFPENPWKQEPFLDKIPEKCLLLRADPGEFCKTGFFNEQFWERAKFPEIFGEFFRESQVTPAKRSFVFVAGARPHQKHCVYRHFVPHQTKTRKKCRFSQVLGLFGRRKSPKIIEKYTTFLQVSWREGPRSGKISPFSGFISTREPFWNIFFLALFGKCFETRGGNGRA